MSVLNAYRVSGNSDGCTVYLTDLQSNITVSAESSYDTDHLTVDTSAGSGVRIRKDCGSTVNVGTDIEFEIYVADDDRYAAGRGNAPVWMIAAAPWMRTRPPSASRARPARWRPTATACCICM